MNRKGFSPLIILGIVAAIIIIGAVGYLALQRTKSPATPVAQVQQPSSSQTVLPSTSTQPTTTSTTPVLVASTTNSVPSSTTDDSGLENDTYGLFSSIFSDFQEFGQYIDGGTITSGTYDGYHVVIAVINGVDVKNNMIYFATKDYKTFIVNASSSDYYNDDPENNDIYNRTKVVGFGSFTVDSPPKTISLGNFALVQNGLHGNITTSTPLASLVPGLTFYNYLSNSNNISLNSEGDASLFIPGTYSKNEGEYENEYDDVLVKTPSSPLYDYLMISKEEFADSIDTLSYLNYKGVTFYQQNEISSTVPLYQAYGALMPGSCGGTDRTFVLQNISQSDLVQIGSTLNGIALYTFKDPNNQYNKDEFGAKITELIQQGDTSTYNFTDDIVPFPSYNDYVAKSPVIIFQDPWGRWVGLGELYYAMQKDCPVP